VRTRTSVSPSANASGTFLACAHFLMFHFTLGSSFHVPFLILCDGHAHESKNLGIINREPFHLV
jgi:hypothetical protein